jgi:hypothetical protein
MWDFAKGNLTEEIQNTLLLATDSEGHTAWHWAAYWGEPTYCIKYGIWLKTI